MEMSPTQLVLKLPRTPWLPRLTLNLPCSHSHPPAGPIHPVSVPYCVPYVPYLLTCSATTLSLYDQNTEKRRRAYIEFQKQKCQAVVNK